MRIWRRIGGLSVRVPRIASKVAKHPITQRAVKNWGRVAHVSAKYAVKAGRYGAEAGYEYAKKRMGKKKRIHRRRVRNGRVVVKVYYPRRRTKIVHHRRRR